jgi:hypothetical protein
MGNEFGHQKLSTLNIYSSYLCISLLFSSKNSIGDVRSPCPAADTSSFEDHYAHECLDQAPLAIV